MFRSHRNEVECQFMNIFDDKIDKFEEFKGLLEDDDTIKLTKQWYPSADKPDEKPPEKPVIFKLKLITKPPTLGEIVEKLICCKRKPA